MKSIHKITVIFLFLAVFCGFTASAQEIRKSRSPAPGVEYLFFNAGRIGAVNGKGIGIHVLRIDPYRAKLRLLAASEYDKKLRTAADWCREFKLIAAINAGMFLKDYLTNVGYLRNGAHVQNGRWNGKYRSALAFDPQKPGLPPAIMVDLDTPDAKDMTADYGAVVQNLRLLRADGVNVWEKSDRQWSEAAVGMDKEGRVCFIFCGAPMPMWKFNKMVSSLGLGIVRMMHMEGGSLASLSVKGAGIALNLAGAYETGALESGHVNGAQMPLPNVIGVAR
jgi:hypothetical protein